MRPIDSRRLSREKKDKILERDKNQCVYCTEEAEEVDHVIPWSWRHDDSYENLVASCWLCNHIASNKMFDGIQEKKTFILKKREKILRSTVIGIWTEDELKYLGPGMRKDVKNNCIVAATHKDALHFSHKLRAVGLETRFG